MWLCAVQLCEVHVSTAFMGGTVPPAASQRSKPVQRRYLRRIFLRECMSILCVEYSSAIDRGEEKMSQAGSGESVILFISLYLFS